ncbi:MAG: Peptide chain release factor 2 [Candidatus Doudnabacteria bacterium Gr01-1014_77]|jgi:peptide chain release factor 2|uniref:Peptide chain release factor 2 n=1 Tax=Candidatus Doudnabacteria bacterium Gr01-1014_77 TaxID=2017133 RepID=A0A554JDD4_9BACT|nr:MAG: Peptide chain release factor 2 [Candidatus Doudnabacteria bacterium Gr01-1014_77]
MQAGGFWADQQTAKTKSEQYNALKTEVDFWTKLQKDVEDLFVLSSELFKSGTVESTDKGDIEKQLEQAKEKFMKARIQAFFSKKYDDHGSILAIHAGAGGSDAQDWAEMLLRMYMRFCEKHGFKVETLELSKGSEAGIKSVLLEVSGHNAYGFLRCEAGVHRVVRLSEFNPAHTRETSFALVEVLPLLEHQEGITIDPKDLKIETTTASGHGGQSVNTTYSAVRITHIPTGVKVSIQNERSQSQNREKAMEILQSRLNVLEEERRMKEKKEMRGEFKSAEWGNQIRSYVLHPYKMVKDHRTGYESTDPSAVLNGDLDDFIEKYLETTV